MEEKAKKFESRLDPRSQAIVDRLLIAAAEEGDAYRIESLLEEGANPSAHGQKDGRSALMRALPHGPEGLALLLDAGADPNFIATGDGPYARFEPTALHMAVAWGDAPVRALLAAGADPGIRDELGRTALMWAVGSGPGRDAATRLLEWEAGGAMIEAGMTRRILDDALRCATEEHARGWVARLARAGANIKALPRDLDPKLTAKEAAAFEEQVLQEAVEPGKSRSGPKRM